VQRAADAHSERKAGGGSGREPGRASAHRGAKA
jgi:hypothetical protein